MATLQPNPLAEADSAVDPVIDPTPNDPTPTAQTVRAAINRRNAQHSTGPKTPEGKDAVRLNALKSGIYAKTILLPHEDRARYDQIGADLAQDCHPQTPQERRLVQDIQDTEWRITRVIAIETNLHMVVATQQIETVQAMFGLTDPLESLAMGQVAGFLANSRVFDQLNRQEARLRRLRTQQLRELCARIDNRPKAPPAPQPAPQPQPAPAAGFVPPKPETAPPVPSKPGLFDGVPDHILDRMPNFVGKTAEMHQKEWLKKHWNGR